MKNLITILAVIGLAGFLTFSGCSSKDDQHGHAGHDHNGAEKSADTVWTCPMHPEVEETEPGLCPECNMKLVPEK